ncbi:MAG: beta-N-acetylhexosaminidase [Clostridia bacterium]|nr:beta-N-acetylhexosaminidase [Clostridia bacterium]
MQYQRFGVMLDMSRNAVMKVEQVKRMIDCLAKMGYNTLELYCEDTYELDGEPYFGYLRGRYTAEELKEIDAYATQKGIELIPCIQTLAHFTNLVRHPAYYDMVDVNDILLIDEPKTYELIEKIFAMLADTFTSRNVNIGMDEAHMVGRGKYMDKHGYVERYDLLVRHLQKVAEIAAKYGFKAHMWSDMFFRIASNGDYYGNGEIPEHVKKCLPENVDLTYWDYYHTDKPSYDRLFDRHLEFGHDVWFAGGAWTWVGFAPLLSQTVASMKPAMQSVVEKGIKNVLITMWGDNGKECSFFAMLHGLYAIRQYADGNFDDERIAKGFEETFGVSYADFALLDLPNKPYEEYDITTPLAVSKAMLYADPFMGWLDKNISNFPTFTYGKYADMLAEAATRAKEYGYIFDCTSKLCKVLDIKAELGIRVRKAYQNGDRAALGKLVDEMTALESRLQVFHQAFALLWYKENKAHGFEVQDARIGGLIQRVRTCKGRLQAYLAGEIESLDELQEEILEYFGGKRLGHNSYTQLITMSHM